MLHGKVLWSEDDATPGTDGHEGLPDAWQRLFGVAWDPKQALTRMDCGDGVYFRLPDGVVVWSSYPGNSAIYAPPETQ